MATRTDKDFSNVNPHLVDAETNVEIASGNLESDLYIDHRDLQEEFLKQPELFAWWATMAEIAKDLVSRQKFFVDRLAAKIDFEIRNPPPLPNGEKDPTKITEKLIEHRITVHPDYEREMFRYLEYKKQLGLLQAGQEAMVQRKDMLISLGANYRAEASSNPTILRDAARERSRKAMELHKAQQEYEETHNTKPTTSATPSPTPRGVPKRQP
jgi:hypothetical protein